MLLKDRLYTIPMADKEALATKLGTTVKYLRKLAGGHCLPSLEMARAIKRELPEVSYEDHLKAHDEWKKSH